MPIAIACPHCDWKGKVPDNLAGKKGKCPTCGELIPIKKPSGPPPLSRGKADEPEFVDDAEIVEDEPRPKPAAGRRRPDDDDDDRPARSRRRQDDDEDDDRPRKRRPADDEDDRPARSRRRDEDDEDDRPSRSRRRPADDEDDERPARSRRRDEDDEDDRPRKRRGGPKRRPKKSGISGKRIGAIVGGLFALLVGGAWLAYYLMSDGGRFRIYPLFLLVGGLIGLFQGATGMGLGEDEE